MPFRRKCGAIPQTTRFSFFKAKTLRIKDLHSVKLCGRQGLLVRYYRSHSRTIRTLGESYLVGRITYYRLQVSACHKITDIILVVPYGANGWIRDRTGVNRTLETLHSGEVNQSSSESQSGRFTSTQVGYHVTKATWYPIACETESLDLFQRKSRYPPE